MHLRPTTDRKEHHQTSKTICPGVTRKLVGFRTEGKSSKQNLFHSTRQGTEPLFPACRRPSKDNSRTSSGATTIRSSQANGNPFHRLNSETCSIFNEILQENCVRPVFVQPVFVQPTFVQLFSSNPIRLG